MPNELAKTSNTGTDLLPYFQKGCDVALGIYGIVANVVTTVGGYIDADLERKAITERQFMEHQYNLQIAELQKEETEIRCAYETRQAEIQAKKELEIAKMQEETNQLKIMEQSKCLQKALDVALASYNRKLDFYQAQLKSCEDFFRPQIAAMHEEIRNLESKMDESFNDTNTYVLLQKRLNRLNEYCDEVNAKYLKLQGDLTTAVKLAQLEAPDASAYNLGNHHQPSGYLN